MAEVTVKLVRSEIAYDTEHDGEYVKWRRDYYTVAGIERLADETPMKPDRLTVHVDQTAPRRWIVGHVSVTGPYIKKDSTLSQRRLLREWNEDEWNFAPAFATQAALVTVGSAQRRQS